MFERKSYKEIAKKQLKGRWQTPVLATLLIMGLLALLRGPAFIDEIKDFISGLLNGNFSKEISNDDNGFFRSFSFQSSTPIFFNFTGLDRLGLISSLLVSFVMGVLIIAQSHLYLVLSHTTEVQPFSSFISGFASWLDGFLGILWFYLWTLLWSLLFIIPGIVKAFSYSQMFFILAEHPGVGVTKAMRLSKVITKGFKGDLFVMSLSFLGWDILCALTFGILGLWLTPYKWMSYTNAYHAMKAHALNAGDVTMEDFTGVKEEKIYEE